jgi:hypothetical protein
VTRLTVIEHLNFKTFEMSNEFYKLDITETQAELKQLLRIQKTASAKERVQLLYLLKSGQAPTVESAATLLGRNRVTVQKWMSDLTRKSGQLI